MLPDIENLEATSGCFPDAVDAVRGLSLRVAEGKSFGAVGESGSGNSTVRRAICGFARPVQAASGRAQEPLAAPREAALHRRVPMAFQDPYASIRA